MNFITRAILFILVLSSSAKPVYCQENSRLSSIQANYKYGFLVTHRDEIPNSIRNRNPQGLDMLWSAETSGTKAWHHFWNFPRYGFSLGYFDLDQKQTLGEVVYATIFFEKEIIKTRSRHQLNYRIAPGLSYSNVVYDSESNPDNILISEEINFIMEGSLVYRYQLSEHWHLNAGIYLTHYSNGAVKFPNIGVNIPSLSLGLSYNFEGNEDDVNRPLNPFQFVKSNDWQAIASVSWKSAGEEYEDLDFAYTLSLQRVWHSRPKYSWVAGLDLMFNSTAGKILDNEDANPYRAGILGGVQFELGKLAFVIQAGAYVYRPEKDWDEPIYTRWGFKRQLHKNLFASLMIKTHYARADLIEAGIGYNF